MFFWFAGTAIITVWFVFQDPRFDYRLLIVGSVLPLLDAPLGGVRVLHTLVFSLVLMAVVMGLSVGRRPRRKLLLGLPIGTLLHLVFDGAWTDTDLFWWPFGGWTFDDARVPELERGWWALVLEVVGLVLLTWVWRVSGLSTVARRRQFWRSGQLFAGPVRRR